MMWTSPQDTCLYGGNFCGTSPHSTLPVTSCALPVATSTEVGPEQRIGCQDDAPLKSRQERGKRRDSTVIPALVRLKQGDCHHFETSRGHVVPSQPFSMKNKWIGEDKLHLFFYSTFPSSYFIFFLNKKYRVKETGRHKRNKKMSDHPGKTLLSKPRSKCLETALDSLWGQ